jgi:phosphoglucomutase
MSLCPHAGKPAGSQMLVDVRRPVVAYQNEKPDSATPRQRVAFGTSGHRGSLLDGTLNEDHVFAIRGQSPL